MNNGKFPQVKVLIDGYAIWLEAHKQKACGTITLVKGLKNNCLIDTGNVGDEQKIKQALKTEGLTPDGINYVINTHGDIDHVGNNCLFKSAIFISGQDIYEGDVASFFVDKYEIEPGVEVINTPGHSIEDISVVVRTRNGIVVIAGDIYENETDAYDHQAWKVFSKYPKKQVESRKKIWQLADWIVPGHGGMFKAKKRK